MGLELTAFDIKHLVKEWQILVGGRINKIYQPKETEILILVYTKGKHFLRIALPSMMYLTQYKGEMPEQPFGFCKFLRKRLNNAIITKISQHDFERTVIADLETKETTLRLIVELFSHGNIIVCDKDNKILSLMAARSSEHRELRGGIEYTFPTKNDVHFLNITKKEFSELVKKSSEENSVKLLAKELGLGGKYAEEIIARAGESKEKQSMDATNVFGELEKFREEPTKSVIYYENDKPNAIAPVHMQTKESLTCKEFAAFNEAIDSIVTNIDIVSDSKMLTDKHKKEIEKATDVLKQQLAVLEGREKEIEECEIKAKAIYEHYTTLHALLVEMRATAKKETWDAMKKKFEKHPLVKKIDLQKKEVTVKI